MSERTYYVKCKDDCLFEGMTKEQILAAIEQAVSTGEIKDVDTGFITKIKEVNKNNPLMFWVGTAAEFNALEVQEENVFYIITDTTEGEDIYAAINELTAEVNNLQTAIEDWKKEFNKTLWTGTFKNTSTEPITVTGFENYSLFAITVNGRVYVTYRSKNDNTLEGCVFKRTYSASSDKDVQYNYYCSVTYSGNKITAVEANDESSMYPVRTANLTKIVGIV